MIKVYKQFDAIQYIGTNQNEFSELLTKYNIFEPVAISDWLVYSPYKDQWKVYTDKEFNKDFKTLEQLNTNFKELEKERIENSFVSVPNTIEAFQWIEINEDEIDSFLIKLSKVTKCAMSVDIFTKDNGVKLYAHTYTYTDIGRHLDFELNPLDWLVYDCIKQSFNKYTNSEFEAILRFVK